MKILMLIQRPQARGQEIFASQLGNELIKLGHQVQVVSLFDYGKFNIPFTGIHLSLGLHSKLNLLQWKPWIKLKTIVQKFQPDIVQANGGDTFLVTALAKKSGMIPCKLVFNNGGVVNYYIQSSLQRKFYRFLGLALDACVHVSTFSYLDFQSLVEGEFINGRKLEFETYSLVKKTLNSQRKIPQTVIPIGIPITKTEKRVVVTKGVSLICVAGFTAEKNQLWLINHFSYLSKRFSKISCTFFGDGPLLEECKKIAMKDYPDQLIFKGAVDNPWTQIPANACLILPSLMEGCPAVVAEAMQNKIPVFASAVGGLPEMIEETASCFLFNLHSIDSLLDQMNNWVQLSENEKDGRLNQSHELVQRRFDLQIQTEQFLNFYQYLCG